MRGKEKTSAVLVPSLFPRIEILFCRPHHLLLSFHVLFQPINKKVSFVVHVALEQEPYEIHL